MLSETRRGDKSTKSSKLWQMNVKPMLRGFGPTLKEISYLMSGIGDINVSDDTEIEQVIDDDEEKSNLFADYFSSVFNRESEANF